MVSPATYQVLHLVNFGTLVFGTNLDEKTRNYTYGSPESIYTVQTTHNLTLHSLMKILPD